MSPQPHNPLHGVTLATIVTELQAHYGWEELGRQINIRCFTQDPSVASSLKFLRRTPWAREKVESFYLFYLRERRRQQRAGADAGRVVTPADEPSENAADNPAEDPADDPADDPAEDPTQTR